MNPNSICTLAKNFVGELIPLGASGDLLPLLNPENVFISEDGISLKDTNTNNPAARIEIYPGYSPPEYYQNRTADCSSVYFVGALVYTLLTGMFPPDAETRGLSNAPLFPAGDVLEGVVNRATALEETNRIPNLQSLWQELNQAEYALVFGTNEQHSTQPMAAPEAHALPAELFVASDGTTQEREPLAVEEQSALLSPSFVSIGAPEEEELPCVHEPVPVPTAQQPLPAEEMRLGSEKEVEAEPETLRNPRLPLLQEPAAAETLQAEEPFAFGVVHRPVPVPSAAETIPEGLAPAMVVAESGDSTYTTQEKVLDEDETFAVPEPAAAMAPELAEEKSNAEDTLQEPFAADKSSLSAVSVQDSAERPVDVAAEEFSIEAKVPHAAAISQPRDSYRLELEGIAEPLVHPEPVFTEAPEADAEKSLLNLLQEQPKDTLQVGHSSDSMAKDENKPIQFAHQPEPVVLFTSPEETQAASQQEQDIPVTKPSTNSMQDVPNYPEYTPALQSVPMQLAEYIYPHSGGTAQEHIAYSPNAPQPPKAEEMYSQVPAYANYHPEVLEAAPVPPAVEPAQCEVPQEQASSAEVALPEAHTEAEAPAKSLPCVASMLQNEQGEKPFGETPLQAPEKKEFKKFILPIAIALVLLLSFFVYTLIQNSRIDTALSRSDYSAVVGTMNSTPWLKIFTPQKYAYAKAQLLLQEGKWEESIEAFEGLEDYESSPELLKTAKYQKAMLLLQQGKLEESLGILKSIAGYKDSAAYATQLEAYLKAQKSPLPYEQYAGYKSIAGFLDSKEKADALEQKVYNEALTLYNEQNFVDSGDRFAVLGTYQDAALYAEACGLIRSVTSNEPNDNRDAYENLLALSNRIDVSNILMSNPFLILFLEGRWTSPTGGGTFLLNWSSKWYEFSNYAFVGTYKFENKGMWDVNSAEPIILFEYISVNQFRMTLSNGTQQVFTRS